MIIRLARPSDASAIDSIYDGYVTTSTCTWEHPGETKIPRADWLTNREEIYPVTVVEIENAVVGWGSLSPFRPRAGYRHTVENSLYVKEEFHHRGVGRALLADLISRAATFGHHSILAAISADQDRSILLHRSFGFQEVGRIPQAGFKFGVWHDLVLMQLLSSPD